jgi:hypothetical protein
MSENREVVIDGHEFDDEDSNLLGDGDFPPFAVFSTGQQEYVETGFSSRADAKKWARDHGYVVTI